MRQPQGQLFWREAGKGPTLLFLHGAFQEGSQWLPLVEQLAVRFHCLIPDLPGFGESDPPAGGQSISHQAECLAAYIAALRLEAVYIVAHSLGAWIATQYALMNPRQLKGLILLQPEGIATDRRYLQRWQLEKRLTATVPLVPWCLQLAAPIARLLGRDTSIRQQLAYRQRLLAAPATCQLLFQRREAEITAELLNPHLSELLTPTQVIQGAQDTSGAIARSKTLVKLAPAAQLRLIKDGNAQLLAQSQTAIAYEIERFMLKQTPAAS